MKTKYATQIGPIIVKHHPYGYGDRKHEEPWKEAVATACKKFWGDRPPIEQPISLKIKFYLSPDKDYDLTGMLESTVNAIAYAIFPPRKGGHKTKWNHEDRWVVSIEASKLFRYTDHGAEIIIEY